jgi:hypothetical protein
MQPISLKNKEKVKPPKINFSMNNRIFAYDYETYIRIYL